MSWSRLYHPHSDSFIDPNNGKLQDDWYYQSKVYKAIEAQEQKLMDINLKYVNTKGDKVLGHKVRKSMLGQNKDRLLVFLWFNYLALLPYMSHHLPFFHSSFLAGMVLFGAALCVHFLSIVWVTRFGQNAPETFRRYMYQVIWKRGLWIGLGQLTGIVMLLITLGVLDHFGIWPRFMSFLNNTHFWFVGLVTVGLVVLLCTVGVHAFTIQSPERVKALTESKNCFFRCVFGVGAVWAWCAGCLFRWHALQALYDFEKENLSNLVEHVPQGKPNEDQKVQQEGERKYKPFAVNNVRIRSRVFRINDKSFKRCCIRMGDSNSYFLRPLSPRELDKQCLVLKSLLYTAGVALHKKTDWDPSQALQVPLER